jgi:putative protease
MSNTIFCAKNLEDYQFLKQLGVNRILLSGLEFSRLGEISSIQLKEVYQDAIKNNIKLEVECDVLPTQMQFQNFVTAWENLNILPHPCLSIRIQDLGLLNYFYQKNYSIIPLLESGYHNIEAIQKIKESYGDRVDHFVLSKELIFNKQRQYAHQYLTQGIELNLIAPILLFYSPRKLLSSFVPSTHEAFHQAFAASQESVHKGFIVRENKWGTLFYHPKHQNLISKLDDFKKDNAVNVLIDLRLVEEQSLRFDLIKKIQHMLSVEGSIREEIHRELMDLFPFPTTRGFYDVNKTDVLFPKLKNHHSEHDSYHRIGEVLDVVKGENLIIRIMDGEQLKLGDQLYLQSPQGNNGVLTLSKLFNLAGDPKSVAEANDLVKINFMKHFPSQSTVFKIHENHLP